MPFVSSIDCLDAGFLPKREETFEQYERRNLEKNLKLEALKAYFAKRNEEALVPDDLLFCALRLFEEQTGLLPNWACAIYSNQGLGWLHLGALVEIQEASDQKTKISFIQLHKRWQRHATWWGYQRCAVIAHELVHLIRYELDDETYEEFIACQFEKKAFRRLGGALFSTPSRATTILLALLTMTLSFGLIGLESLGEIALPSWLITLSWMLLWTSLAALFLLLFQFAGQVYRWQRFCKKGKQMLSTQDFFRFSLLIYSQDLSHLSQLKPEQWNFYLSTLPAGPYQAALEKIFTSSVKPDFSP